MNSKRRHEAQRRVSGDLDGVGSRVVGGGGVGDGGIVLVLAVFVLAVVVLTVVVYRGGGAWRQRGKRAVLE